MHLLYARELTKMMRDVGLVEQNEPFKRLFNQGQILGARRRADVEVARQHRGPRRSRRPLRRRHGPAVPDVHGPVGPGRAVEPDRDRWRASLPQPGLDPGRSIRTGREPGDPDVRHAAGRPDRGRRCGRRSDPPRTRRCATSPPTTRRSASTSMLAKLMELANTLFRYRGTAVAGSAAWDEAISLLLLMLAPAAPAHHRGAVEPSAGGGRQARGRRSTPRPGPTVDPSAVVESTREIPVQVNGKLRDKVTVAGRRDRRRDRGGGPRPRADPGASSTAGRPTGSSSPAAAGWSTSSSGDRLSEDAVAFDRHLDATAPAVAEIARALPPDGRSTGFPGRRRVVRPGGRAARDRREAVDARPAVRDHPAPGAREPAARRRCRPAEPRRPDRGHRQAGPPRQGPLGRGRVGAVAPRRRSPSQVRVPRRLTTIATRGSNGVASRPMKLSRQPPSEDRGVPRRVCGRTSTRGRRRSAAVRCSGPAS